MMQIILNSMISWTVPTILTAILSLIVWAFKKITTDMLESIDRVTEKIIRLETKFEEETENNRRNFLSILWSQLESKCNTVLDAGTCSVSTKACIEQLFAQYKAIGGNHGMSVKVKEVLALCEK